MNSTDPDSSARHALNEAHATAKIAGAVMSRTYMQKYGIDATSTMPTNFYGPGDNYHPENSHAVPALIRRSHTAKPSNSPEVTIWGSARSLREFLHGDELASVVIFLMRRCSSPDIVNEGSGHQVSIEELARIVAHVTGDPGSLTFGENKPDGTPRKRLDTSRLDSIGWRPNIYLKKGLAQTCKAFTRP